MQESFEWINQHIIKFNLDNPDPVASDYGDRLANFTLGLITSTMAHSMETRRQLLESIQSGKDLEDKKKNANKDKKQK